MQFNCSSWLETWTPAVANMSLALTFGPTLQQPLGPAAALTRPRQIHESVATCNAKSMSFRQREPAGTINAGSQGPGDQAVVFQRRQIQTETGIDGYGATSSAESLGPTPGFRLLMADIWFRKLGLEPLAWEIPNGNLTLEFQG